MRNSPVGCGVGLLWEICWVGKLQPPQPVWAQARRKWLLKGHRWSYQRYDVSHGRKTESPAAPRFFRRRRPSCCRTSIPRGWPSWPKLSENTTVRRLVGSWNIERSYVEQLRTHCFFTILIFFNSKFSPGSELSGRRPRTHHLIDKIQIVTDHFSFAFVKLLLYQTLQGGCAGWQNAILHWIYPISLKKAAPHDR